jgi:hypothetical protein
MVMVLKGQSKAAGWRAVVVGMAIVGAWLAIGAGLVAAGSGASGQGSAQVPVRVSFPWAYTDVVLPCVQGWSLDGGGCEPAAPAAQWQGGTPLPVRHSGGLETATDGTGPVASVLAMAPRWVGLVGGGLVVLLLLPVVRSTASGRLFEQAIARRLALAAGTVLAAWILASAGPALAAPSFIERMEQTLVYGAPPDGFPMPHGWLTYDPDITWWPLLIVALLGILATATRSGARLATDTAGLV